MNTSFKSFVVALALLCTGSRASELVIEGRLFAATHSVSGAVLRLHNASLLKVGLIFKVYAAGLYLADGADVARVLEDVPKRLEIAYLRDIPSQALVDAAENHLKENHSTKEIAALRARLDAINALYADVKAGDLYALTYRPGFGCELARNGKPLGVIPGADFAAVYFGIWLGPGCSRPEFRDALLRPR